MSRVERKAGVVPYRRRHGVLECLLITARTHPSSWIFPLGGIEQGEKVREAAARECREESGCLVKVGRPLLEVDLSHEGVIHRVRFFLAEVTGQVDEWETDRSRRWVSVRQMEAEVPEAFLSVAHAARQILLADDGGQ